MNPLTSSPGFRPRRSHLSAGGVLLLFALFLALAHPWGLRMGGRWTPALTWRGQGQLHASTGATYRLWLTLYPRPFTRTSRFGDHTNVEGTATLCTPQGVPLVFDVHGYVDAWFDTNGKPVSLYFQTKPVIRPTQKLSLFGAWNGEQLELDDRGTLAKSFRADGTAKGFAQGAPAPKDIAHVALSYVKQRDFAQTCSSSNGASF